MTRCKYANAGPSQYKTNDTAPVPGTQTGAAVRQGDPMFPHYLFYWRGISPTMFPHYLSYLRGISPTIENQFPRSSLPRLIFQTPYRINDTCLLVVLHNYLSELVLIYLPGLGPCFRPALYWQQEIFGDFFGD